MNNQLPLEEVGPPNFVATKKFFWGVLAVLALIVFVFLPPTNFPAGQTITVGKDASLGEVSYFLREKAVIRSRMMFEFCMISMGGDKHVLAGDYLFKEPINACAVASRIAEGRFGVPAVKITFPEGVSNAQVAEIAVKNLPKFDAKLFVANAQKLEGYLFPETYFFSPSATAEEVIQTMNAQFKKKTETLTLTIEKSGRPLKDIVIMASILEKEARTPEDQALVSGILWKRITKGMALQVDAPFYYLLGKESAELTVDDLALKSAYNTYKNRGLTPGPIGNPGLGAIRAALEPTASPYLYYLSDKNGVMHYAKTFEEHKANKVKYLR